MRDVVESLIILRNLNTVERFNITTTLHRQNVASHSLQTSFIAWYLAKLLNDKGVDIDMRSVFINAAVHDVDEAVLGDIILPTKYNNGLNDIYEETARKIRRDLLKKLGLDAELVEEGIVRDVVKLADMIEGYIYSLEEITLGNKRYREIAYNYEKRIYTHLNSKLPMIKEEVTRFIETLKEDVTRASDPIKLRY